MSNSAHDCSSIEQRITEYNLYISTTQDQANKVDPNNPEAQNQRDAMARKLNNLQEQLALLQQALENCQQGKGTNLPDFEIVPENG